MKREDRDAWVADLRANPERQGRTYLSSASGECCLGRYALLKGVPYQSIETNRAGLIKNFYFGEDEDMSFPSRSWLEEQGIPYRLAEALAIKNDMDHSFAEIANFIETYIPVED